MLETRKNKVPIRRVNNLAVEDEGETERREIECADSSLVKNGGGGGGDSDSSRYGEGEMTTGVIRSKKLQITFQYDLINLHKIIIFSPFFIYK